MKNDEKNGRGKLFTVGDPQSELNVQRRLNFLRSGCARGVVYVPKSWVDQDLAMKKAVEELDWLRVEKHR
jgi:hypothetical protein